MKRDMIKFKLIIYLLILLIFASCGTLKRDFRIKKKIIQMNFWLKKITISNATRLWWITITNAKDDQVNENESKVKKLITNNTETNNSNSKVSPETDLKNIVLDKIKNN